MNTYYSVLILTLKLFLICASENIESMGNQDFAVIIKQDGEEIQLKAIKSPENDLIIKEKNIKNYQKLKWYSIGNPMLVKLMSNGSENIFKFNRRGFYARIEMLTYTHQQLLI